MPKNREPFPDFSDVRVRLKPFLGVAPGVYLTVLYALALLVLAFLLLVLPGLRANGTIASFATSPAGADVWIDGDYRGSTPCEVFVEKGDRDVELRKAFYESVSIKRSFGGRVLASRLLPRRARIAARMRVNDSNGLADWAGGQVAEWGLLRDFSPAYPLPPILSEAVGALARLGDPAALDLARSLLATAAAAADSEAELGELAAATAALGSRGGFLSPAGVGRMLRSGRDLARGTTSFPLWVVQALDSRNPLRASLAASPVLTAHAGRLLSRLQAYESVPATAVPAGAPVIAGVRFLPVPGGIELVGRGVPEAAERLDIFLPAPVRVEPFHLAETEVTRGQFAQFLAAEPRWADRIALLRDGRATSSYLEGWDGPRFPTGTENLPVVGVSHYAATAFAAWLTTRLGPALSAYEVLLPTEAQWQRAAGRAPAEGSVFLGAGGVRPAGASQAGPYGQRDLWGNAWEWCREGAFPVRNLLAPVDPDLPDPLAHARAAERIVKGGSWANSKEDFRSYVRGSQPPDWCTPYTGFRVALIRRSGQGPGK